MVMNIAPPRARVVVATAMIGSMRRDCQPRIVKQLCVVALAIPALAATGRDYAMEFGVGAPSQSGYLQTPAGGMPGTASLRRPTLAEIDLDGGHYRWLGASVDFGRMGSTPVDSPGLPFPLRLNMRYSSTGEEASTVLAETFTIRGGEFEVGDPVRSRVTFDALSLGLTAGFRFGSGLSAELGAQVGWTAFDFTMVGERHRSERAYHVTAVGLVGAVSKDFGNGWRLAARFNASPAIEGTGSGYALEPILARDLSEHFTLAVSVRIEGFRYDDAHKQTLPNRIQVTRRVVPAVSVRLRL